MVEVKTLMCDRDGNPDAVSYEIYVDGERRELDLCPTCAAPLLELFDIAKAPEPRLDVEDLPRSVRPLESLIRGVDNNR